MLKRNVIAPIILSVVLGGGAVAWSQATGPDAPTPPTSPPDRAAVRAAMDQCRTDAGVTEGTRPTPEQRQAVGECLRAAGVEKPALAHRHRHPDVLGRAVHGDLIVRTPDGFEEVTVDRGVQKSLEGDTLTITRPDGVDVSLTLTDDTTYKGVEDASGLENGRRTFVVSKDGNATHVGQREGTAQPSPA